MINANEIRIGNWVSQVEYNRLMQVKHILSNGVRCDYERKDVGKTHTSLFNFNEIQPIPLTPEILEKCGAIVYCFDNGNPNQYRIKDRLFVIRDGNIVDYGSSVVIKHLHQLQNLYFALTNSELNYTP
jgi:hypothetical protein